MSKLFNTLPEGCLHLAGYLDMKHQGLLVEECRKLVKDYPLVYPTTKSGHQMALKVSSWGKVGWFGSNGNYFYSEVHPETYMRWPPIPILISKLMYEALVVAGYKMGKKFDTVLMNWYPPLTGRLGKHRDVTEEDQESPIVTISLGDSATFFVGGLDYDDKGQRVTLRSGDIFVMGGPSRLIYHEIEKLIPADPPLFPKGGRISLTGRRVFSDG